MAQTRIRISTSIDDEKKRQLEETLLSRFLIENIRKVGRIWYIHLEDTYKWTDEDIVFMDRLYCDDLIDSLNIVHERIVGADGVERKYE